MSVSGRARILAGFLLVNAAIAVVAIAVFLNRPDSPPLIQGVLLPEAREIQRFSLLDHHNETFTNADLQGGWQLLSYGYTTCPDICPTTLSQLATVATQLQRQGRGDLRILFYTVDHRRDTVSQLAAYVPFFHSDFVGLTHLDDPDNPHLPFEQSLGIAAQLVPNTEATAESGANDYQVYHGVALFLINPEGRLQAIFKPGQGATGAQSFDPDKILGDYLAIRRYLD